MSRGFEENVIMKLSDASKQYFYPGEESLDAARFKGIRNMTFGKYILKLYYRLDLVLKLGFSYVKPASNNYYEVEY